MDLTGKHVFLSGPITGIEDYNSKAFEEAEKKAISLGATAVYNPTAQTKDKTQSHEFYMLLSISELSRLKEELPLKPFYDYVVYLDGTEKSKGAALELFVAHEIGIKYISLEELDGQE